MLLFYPVWLRLQAKKWLHPLHALFVFTVDLCYFAEVSEYPGIISAIEYLDRTEKPDQLADKEGKVFHLQF